MPRSVQLNLPPSPLERVEMSQPVLLHKEEMSLDEAKAVVGRAVKSAIRIVGAGLKDFGDKSQVGRWCSGQENPNLARLWQDPEVRRVVLLALIKESELFDVETHVRERRRA